MGGRRARLGEAHRAARATWAEAAEAERHHTPIGFRWAARCIRELTGPDTIVVNEYPLDLRHAPPPGPGSYIAHPSSGGLGWGFGAALGVQLGARDKIVIATLGDPDRGPRAVPRHPPFPASPEKSRAVTVSADLGTPRRLDTRAAAE